MSECNHICLFHNQIEPGSCRTLFEVKQEIRILKKEKIALLPPGFISEKSKIIQKRVLESIPFNQADTIFLYLSTKSEVQTDMILTEALRRGKKVLVPKCLSKGVMAAIPIRSPQECQPGAYGILEPDVSEEKIRLGEEQMEKSCFLLGILPCISAGKDGSRLGHGAGYYDRFLQKYFSGEGKELDSKDFQHSQTDSKPVMHRMVLCFEDLCCESLPMSNLDQWMEWMITEKGIRSFNRKEIFGILKSPEVTGGVIL